MIVWIFKRHICVVKFVSIWTPSREKMVNSILTFVFLVCTAKTLLLKFHLCRSFIEYAQIHEKSKYLRNGPFKVHNTLTNLDLFLMFFKSLAIYRVFLREIPCLVPTTPFILTQNNSRCDRNQKYYWSSIIKHRVTGKSPCIYLFHKTIPSSEIILWSILHF